MHPKTLSINTRRLVLMANVKDAPFKCLSCKKVFISENHLKRHEDRRHNTKNLSVSSEQVKEDTIHETVNESTIKAVLNATERIEDLLVKLAIRDSEKNPTVPLALSSPRSNFDYSLVTSSSFTSDRHDQNFQNAFISNEKQKEKVELEYNEMGNFQDPHVNSNSIKTEPSTGNCEHFSYENKFVINNNLPMTHSSPRSNFDYSQVASCSFSADKNELKYIENFKPVWSESTFNQKLYGIHRLELRENSGLTDNFSNSIATSKNEENVENYECNSNEITSNKELKIFPPVISSSVITGENGENIENFDYSSNESTYNNNSKEAPLLKSTEKISFKDASGISNSITMDIIEKNLPVASESFTAEKSEQNMGSCEFISDYNVSDKNPIEIANLKYNETSDFGDICAASDYFTQEKSEHNMESSEFITFNSIPLKKSKEITKMTCTDYLEDEENKAIWRLTSSIIRSSNFSLEVLDQRHSGSDLGSEKNDSITPQYSNFIEGSPVIQCHSSIKSDILKKLDSKLESYGINANQNTLSDKDMTRIGNLLKEERDRIAKEIPDYHKLRQLIKDSVHRRIEDNLSVHSFYVS